MHVWVDRVPTKENIADNPSRCACAYICPCTSILYIGFGIFAFVCRESYQILKDMGAKRVVGKLAPIYKKVDTWESLMTCSRPDATAIDLTSD